MIYLASQSPRRSDLLKQIGVKFQVIALEKSYQVDETPLLGELPIKYVQRLAYDKANAGLAFLKRGSELMAPVLGADTIVVIDGEILGKPKDKEDGLSMLRKLSDKTHQVYTSVCVTTEQTHWSCVSSTQVTFKRLTDKEIESYWNTQEPIGKAGAYAIQGYAAAFVEWIEGSFSNVVGLPLFETKQLLDRVDVPIWRE